MNGQINDPDCVNKDDNSGLIALKEKRFRKWLRTAEIYKRFSDKGLDFSEKAAHEMYLHETYGKDVSEMNGYRVGKKVMGITISAWKKDIKHGLLFRFELDREYPAWFIRKYLRL